MDIGLQDDCQRRRDHSDRNGEVQPWEISLVTGEERVYSPSSLSLSLSLTSLISLSLSLSLSVCVSLSLCLAVSVCVYLLHVSTCSFTQVIGISPINGGGVGRRKGKEGEEEEGREITSPAAATKEERDIEVG